jgi:hypothetical protein
MMLKLKEIMYDFRHIFILYYIIKMSELKSPVKFASNISNKVVGTVGNTVDFAGKTVKGVRNVLLEGTNKLTSGILGKGGKKKPAAKKPAKKAPAKKK